MYQQKVMASLYTCSVTALPVAFGNYVPTNGAATNSTGRVSVTCTGIGVFVVYKISLSPGSSGSFANRTMKFGVNNLSYNLYINNTMTNIWGNGTAGTSIVNDSYALILGPITRNYTVYGSLPAHQLVVPGTYSDTITVTVNY